jgi:CRP-like cAMP-binding protein
MHSEAHNVLVEYINQRNKLTDHEVLLFYKYFKTISFKRKELILRNGDIAHQLFFVIKGALHHFFTDQNGQQYSCHFGLPNTFLTDLESFANQRPSTHSIESLDHSLCLQISCVDCVALMSQSNGFNTFIYQMLEEIAQENLRRTTDLIALSPQQRYHKLETNRKNLLQSIPQKYLASYLGISAESLSRLKKRRIIKAKT